MKFLQITVRSHVYYSQLFDEKFVSNMGDFGLRSLNKKEKLCQAAHKVVKSVGL